MAHLQIGSKGTESIWGEEEGPPQHIWQLSTPLDTQDTLQAAKHVLVAPQENRVLQREAGSGPADTLPCFSSTRGHAWLDLAGLLQLIAMPVGHGS